MSFLLNLLSRPRRGMSSPSIPSTADPKLPQLMTSDRSTEGSKKKCKSYSNQVSSLINMKHVAVSSPSHLSSEFATVIECGSLCHSNNLHCTPEMKLKQIEKTVAASVLNDADLLSRIFSCLHWKDILRARVCRTWREAAKLTAVPESMTDGICPTPELNVKNREFAKALKWLANALPKIPSVNILFNVYTTKPFEIADGDGTGQPTMHQSTIAESSGPIDLSPIANFRHLRQLSICGANLNGSYPYMFDFPNLTTLELVDVGKLVWDLEMLRGLPKLEKLTAVRNTHLTGNLNSIRVICETLVKLCLTMCYKVGGDLMDLRDFPQLKEICLLDCNRICGDIRNVRAGDFRSVESFGRLPGSVFGGSYLPSIAATPSIMHSWYILKKQNPRILSGNGLCRLSLSISSSERYSNDVHHSRDMPTSAEFVSAGSRLGWRWTNCCRGGSCEAIWLDPAPSSSDEDYDLYLREFQKVNDDVGFYKGLFAPPMQEEHFRRNEAMPFELTT